MANETNKNRDDRQDKLGNPANADGKMPSGNAGKTPLTGDVSSSEVHTGDTPAITPQGGGRKGNISVEDGGQVEGNSAGSRQNN